MEVICQIENNYLKNVLDAIDKKLQLSLLQYNNTDINKDGGKDKVYSWYASLIKVVNANPPKTYVRSITIIESRDTIKSIEYNYSESKVTPEEIAFTISTEWTL